MLVQLTRINAVEIVCPDGEFADVIPGDCLIAEAHSIELVFWIKNATCEFPLGTEVHLHFVGQATLVLVVANDHGENCLAIRNNTN